MTYVIDKLIINSPHQEPLNDLLHVRDTRPGSLANGRRPTNYTDKSKIDCKDCFEKGTTCETCIKKANVK